MSKFIKSIGNVRFSNKAADLYENKNGSATIRFDCLGTPLPRKHWLLFNSLEDAESFIEEKQGSNGLNTLLNILDHAGV